MACQAGRVVEICSCFIGNLPYRDVVFMGDIDSKKQVEYSLLRRINYHIIKMPLHTRDNFTKPKSFLLTHAGMMCYRASILHWYRITHFIVHLKKAVEKLRLHLDIDLLKHSHTHQLLKNCHVTYKFLSKISTIKRVNTVCSDNTSLYAYLLLPWIRTIDLKYTNFLKCFLGQCEQTKRKIPLLLLLGLDIVMMVSNLKILGQIPIYLLVDNFGVFVRHNTLPLIILLRQIKNKDGIREFVK